MQLQEIYSKYLGEFGKYQLMVTCLLFSIRLPSVVHNIGYVFFARTPGHSCSFDTNSNLNFTSEEWKMYSVPRHPKTRKWSKCQLYAWSRNVNNMTLVEVNLTLTELGRKEMYGDGKKYSCDSWNYDTEKDVHNSLVTQVRTMVIIIITKANK